MRSRLHTEPMSERDRAAAPDSRIDTDPFITVSGPPGSGLTTLSEGLARALDCAHVSGGEVFRELADDRGLSLSELTARAGESEAIDRDLDRRLDRIAETWAAADKPFVLESRLAGWIAGDRADLRVWVDAPEEVRVDRIRDREEMGAEMRVREVIEKQRYDSYYGIDLADRSIYDLAINTARWRPDDVLAIALTAIERYDPVADEGRFPTPDMEI